MEILDYIGQLTDNLERKIVMDIILILASLILGIVEEFRARNGIITKEQRRSLEMSAELARQNAERQRQCQEEHRKRQEEIMKGRW